MPSFEPVLALHCTSKEGFLIKVAFLMSCLLRYDAISNYSYDVMREVSQHHEVSLYVFKTNRNITDLHLNFFTSHHNHNFLEITKVMIEPFSLTKKLSKNDLIVAIVPNASDVPVLPLLSRRVNPRLKLVVDFHGLSPLQHYKGLQRRIIEIYHHATAKYLIKRCNFLIVHSNYMEQEAFRCFQVKAFILPLGVDTKRFNDSISDSDVRKKFHLENNFVLLYVGALSPHKRVHFLSEALFRLKDENVKLLIVGDGPEREKLERHAKTRSLMDRVFFVGCVPDVDLPKYYSACDVFVTASLHEGVCVPILEAFACGKPAIVPNNTAMPETLNGGGLIYQGDSIDSLVHKIKLLRDNVDLRRELGRKGLRVANRRDSTRCMVKYRIFLENCQLGGERNVF